MNRFLPILGPFLVAEHFAERVAGDCEDLEFQERLESLHKRGHPPVAVHVGKVVASRWLAIDEQWGLGGDLMEIFEVDPNPNAGRWRSGE